MKLTIDNFDGRGPTDYTGAIDDSQPPQLLRKLNQPSQLKASLAMNASGFVAPVSGGRVILALRNGQRLFTGYLECSPELEFLGCGESSAFRYKVAAKSDEILLDQKTLPACAPFVGRSAGNALRQLTQDLMPGTIDFSATEDIEPLVGYAPEAQKSWSQQASEIAVQARASYQLSNGSLIFVPLAASTYGLNETDRDFAPQGLSLQPVNGLINDLTVIGNIEPQAYVTDYFIGDGLTLKFYLSQTPFTKKSTVLFDEEYTGSSLDPARWTVADPAHAISVSGGNLFVAGGTGADGATTVEFVEQVEMGGAVVLQHGDIVFTGASTGVLGGLYPGTISASGCLAGFSITPNGTQNNIQALVNGQVYGTAIPTIAGHHYMLTTRLYSREIYRTQQIFHSSLHPAGSGYGGAEIAADVRIVLEVHDIDPSNPASQVAASVVLYDGIVSAAPGFCTYALINSPNLHCSIAFTQWVNSIDAEVRSAIPGQSYSTLLVGTLSDGAACRTTSTELAFFTAHVPAANEQIQVHYRGAGRSVVRVTNPASIIAQQRGVDDGQHGALRHIKRPPARTSADCENAALAMLDDSINPAWSGSYETWSDFLPGGAQDIFPGDAIDVTALSRGASVMAIVREVAIIVEDMQGDHSRYTLQLANDAAKFCAVEFETANLTTQLEVNPYVNTQVGNIYLPDLTAAQITQVSSTTVTINAGIAVANGGGVEARWSDASWGPGQDRNLLGRFTLQTFTLPRLARSQTFFLRQYDASSPPKYSRFSAALHIDFPLGSTL